MLNDHLYASFGNITLGNRLFTIFGDSFYLKTSNKWDDLNCFTDFALGLTKNFINKMFRFELKKTKLQAFLPAKCNY